MTEFITQVGTMPGMSPMLLLLLLMVFLCWSKPAR